MWQVPSYRLTIQVREKAAPSHRHRIRVLTLTREDKHHLQLDPMHTPPPKFPPTALFDIHMPTDLLVM